MKNLYFCTWVSNYDPNAILVQAESEEQAKDIVFRKDPWPGSLDIELIDLESKEDILAQLY